MSRLHRHLITALAAGLQDIFVRGGQADKVIEHLLRSHPRWGARDRAFVAATLYDMVRWWRLLWHGLGEPMRPPEAGDGWRLLAVLRLWRGEELPAWPEWAELDGEAVRQRLADPQLPRAVAGSVPDWLDALAAEELGDEAWGRELAALNRPAPVWLRANRLKTDRDTLAAALQGHGIATRPSALAPDALCVEQRTNLFRLPEFRAGMFEVQDEASQLVAAALAPRPGERVIDACAGAGGKTLHLAALMQGKGQILALDVEEYKLRELRRRARRAGAGTIETRPISSTKIIKRLHNSADALLLDAPCSGTGVLRRNPDAKWKLQPDFLARLRTTQADILERYCRMLKPGGRLVYATCSLLPSENEAQIRRFLASHPQFSLRRQRSLTPAIDSTDGFYLAFLQRTD